MRIFIRKKLGICTSTTKFKRAQRVDWIALSYSRDPENPWFTDTSGFGATWGWTPITEEEYNAVLAKYTRMEIETYPLIEYPLD